MDGRGPQPTISPSPRNRKMVDAKRGPRAEDCQSLREMFGFVLSNVYLNTIYIKKLSMLDFLLANLI
jgi:hypothetical protein